MPARAANFLAGLIQSSPLRHARFRHFYLGAAGTTFGYTMQATAAAWLMTTLSQSPLMVALVQTASTVPSLVFALVAGALADIIERRHVLLATNVLLLITTALIGMATLAGVINPAMLLLLTFVIGVAFTFYMPAQQATVNDLVPRTELSKAVVLSSLAYNVARALGPALAGAIAAWLTSGGAFLVSALFFVGMIVTVWRSPTARPAVPGLPETLLSGIRIGVRYVRHSAPLRALIFRSLTFSFCASSLMALLPVVARDHLGLGAGGFGFLFACFGVGAIASALSISHHLKRVSLNTVVNLGIALWAAAALLVASAHNIGLAIAGAAGAGAAWVAVLTCVSAAGQSWSPAWVRARALAMNLLAMQTGLALGSVIWGWLASVTSSNVSLSSSAAAMLVLLALSYRVHVSFGDEGDVTTRSSMPEMSLVEEPLPDDGPVLIEVNYRIAPENQAAFLQAVQAAEPIRRRNGATAWGVFRDVETEGHFVERYIVRSWAEYIRLRGRFTVVDAEVQESISRLQFADAPIEISRLIAVDFDEVDGMTSRARAET